MNEKKKVVAVILAAGQGHRFAATGGGNKLLAEFKGKALVRHVTEAALSSSACPVMVVTGHEREAIERILGDLPVSFVHNPDYGEGLSTSLRCALAALPQEAVGMIVLLGDMPLITSTLVTDLVIRFEESSYESAAVFPSYRGRRGNPVLLGHKLFKAIAGLAGDEGARRLIESGRQDVLEWPVENAGILVDVDTEDSLKSIV